MRGVGEGKYVVSHISLFCASIKRILVFAHTFIEQTKLSLLTKNLMEYPFFRSIESNLSDLVMFVREYARNNVVKW